MDIIFFYSIPEFALLWSKTLFDEIKKIVKGFILKTLPPQLLFNIKKVHYVRALKSFSESDVDIIKCLVKRGDFVIDIGANVGWYTRILAEIVGENGRVYGIEPIPETFELLSSVIKKLNFKNVQLINCAISDKEGSILMEIPRYEFGGENFYQSKIVEEHKHDSLRRFKVRLNSIDSLFLQLTNNISFIKCDVEGHELKVVKGANQIITQYKPAWLIEISGNPDEKGSDSYLLFNHFEEKGYKAYLFDGKKLNRRSKGDKSVNYFFLTFDHVKFLKMFGWIRS